MRRFLLGIPISLAKGEVLCPIFPPTPIIAIRIIILPAPKSRALSALEWERSGKPLQSWSELLYPALAATGAVIAVLGILY